MSNENQRTLGNDLEEMKTLATELLELLEKPPFGVKFYNDIKTNIKKFEKFDTHPIAEDPEDEEGG